MTQVGRLARRRAREVVDAYRATDFDAFADLGSEANRRLTLIVLGSLGTVGGAVGTAALAPYASRLGMTIGQILAVGAALTGLGLLALSLPARTPAMAIEAILLAAVGAVTAAVWLGTGRVAGETVLVYFWVAVAVAMLRSSRATSLHFAAIAVAAGVVFVADDTFTLPGFWWGLVALTLAVIWQSVGWLVQRARTLAVEERRRRADAERTSSELEEANRRKSAFLATMSHELRTPMNGIIGFADMLQRGAAGELHPPQASYVDDIMVSGRHLASLIDDTLDEIMVETGRDELNLGPADVETLLREAITLVRASAVEGGVDLVTVVDVHESLMVDERKVKQVVANLVANAVRFTPRGGTVTIRARTGDGSCVFSVEDTGPGIDPASRESIFEAFGQSRSVGGPASGDAKARASAHHPGTGLGLTLARQFVELHGGRIWVDSARERGACFIFTLPTSPEADGREPSTAGPDGDAVPRDVDLLPRIVSARELVGRSHVFSIAVGVVSALGALMIDDPTVSTAFLGWSAVLVTVAVPVSLVGLRTLSPRGLVIMLLTEMFAGAVFAGLGFYYLGPLAPAAVAVWLGQAYYVRLLFLKLDMRGTWGHLLIVAVGAGIVLGIQPGNEAPVAQWLAVVGTVAIGSLLVGWLISRLRDIARAERVAALEATRLALELDAASRHKSQFLAGMSHELRTPLGSVIGFAEALDRGIAGPLTDRQREYVDEISRSARHLLGLINDVLDIAKIDAGRLALRVERVDVGGLVDDAIAPLMDRARRKGITMVVEAPRGLEGRLDPGLLARAIETVVANAIRFTPPGGAVAVRVRSDGRTVSIAVEDSGPGVDPADREAIFEEFRLDSANPVRARDGVGLGLALARRLVHSHGGRLSVDASPTGGAVFHLSLLVEPHPSRRPTPPVAAATPT